MESLRITSLKADTRTRGENLEMQICSEPKLIIPKEPKKKERICFVCTGNTCRSPMAEAVLNTFGSGNYVACSAGLSVAQGDKINERSVKALANAGILPSPIFDYREHIATQLDEFICESCDRIIGMTLRHVQAMKELFPEYSDKFYVMSREILDPFMYPQAVYDFCLEEIIEGLKEMRLI